MKEKPDLKIDWCSHEAAKFAVLNWHYSKAMPVGKMVNIGVWEDKKYIGCVLFSRGSNANLMTPYGLTQDQGCELTRVALTKHKTEVTKIVSKAIEMLKIKNPGLRLIISFADQNKNHLGIIYQAGNWIYTGIGKSTPQYLVKGKWVHQRTMGAVRPIKNCPNPKRKILDKYRYLMPLDKKMRRQILPLSKPYPKQICPKGVTGSTTDLRSGRVGSSPASGLKELL